MLIISIAILVLLALTTTANAFFVHHNTARSMQRFMSLSMKQSGTVKFFDTTKGFGFISLGEGEDVFVHQSAVYSQGFRSLAQGEQVEFDVQEDPDTKRRFAINVTGPNGAYVQGAPRRPPASGNFERRF